MTDEARYYNEVGRDFDSHETVNHAREEYVRGDITPTRLKAIIQFSNAARRASTSICAEKHLHRYLSEFDFRYSNRVALGVNDGERADLAIKASASKRLAYRQPH